MIKNFIMESLSLSSYLDSQLIFPVNFWPLRVRFSPIVHKNQGLKFKFIQLKNES